MDTEKNQDALPNGVVVIEAEKQPTIVLTVIMQYGAALSMPEVLSVSSSLSNRQSKERRKSNKFATAPNRKGKNSR